MEQHAHKNRSRDTIITIVLVLLIISSFSYWVYSYWTLKQENTKLSSSLVNFENALSIVQRKLSSTTVEKILVAENLQKEKETNNMFQGQIQNLAGTVGVLEKLSKTDSELLKKYSKVYFLNENYIPEKLQDVDPKYLLQKDKQIQVNFTIWPHLQKMLDDSISAGLNLEILSGYRSFVTQTSLKSAYKVTYGTGSNKFSADQGYSEHQLGTTLDFTTPKIGAILSGFDKTPEYKWLQDNAYRYGFIMSYPKENTYYIFEPWHWRFVGIDLATKLHSNRLYFYSLDQRDIDQFLINLFD